MPTIPRILTTTALCLAAMGGMLHATSSTIHSEADEVLDPTWWKQERQKYKPCMIAWVEYYKQLLVLARDVHDKDSADAAAVLWEKAYIDLHQQPEIVCFFTPTEEEEAAILAEVSATNGNLHDLEQEVEAERARLKKAYYFHSESLARAMDGDPVYAYPCIPATPEVTQLFTDYYKTRLASLIGVGNLRGGLGFSPEKAWLITTTQENGVAIEKHITRKGKLNFQVVFAETKGFRFILSDSGHQRIGEVTYLFHLYVVVPNGGTAAYQLKQYFCIEKEAHEKPSVKSETEIFAIAARELGYDMKGYTARFESPYYYVELTEFEDASTLGGGPALKINAYTGAIEERYFTE